MRTHRKRLPYDRPLLPEKREVTYITLPPIPSGLQPHGIDPELLYVECGRCGAPVIWEAGRATQLLKEAGVDPLELDESCFLVTDACPMCTQQKRQYVVQIYRVSSSFEMSGPTVGNC